MLRHIVDDPDSLPANQTRALFVDRQNQVRAGGVTSGLTRYDQSSRRFRQWLHADKGASSLSGNEVWSVAQTSDGSLRVATQAGRDHLHKDGRGFDHLQLEPARNAGSTALAVRAMLAGVMPADESSPAGPA